MKMFNCDQIVNRSVITGATLLISVALFTQVLAGVGSDQKAAQTATAWDESGREVVLPPPGTKKNVEVKGKPTRK